MEYRAEPFFKPRTPAIIFLVSFGILFFINSNDIVKTALFATGLAIFAGVVEIFWKLLLFRGQYGVTFSIQIRDSFIIRKNGKINSYKFSDITKFGRYNVSRYGSKIHITVKDEEIKFFSPDAPLIENELVKIFQLKGIALNKADDYAPFPGIRYTIEN